MILLVRVCICPRPCVVTCTTCAMAGLSCGLMHSSSLPPPPPSNSGIIGYSGVKFCVTVWCGMQNHNMKTCCLNFFGVAGYAYIWNLLDVQYGSFHSERYAAVRLLPYPDVALPPPPGVVLQFLFLNSPRLSLLVTCICVWASTDYFGGGGTIVHLLLLTHRTPAQHSSVRYTIRGLFLEMSVVRDISCYWVE